MTKSEDVDNIAKNIYFEIISKFFPTIASLNLIKVINKYCDDNSSEIEEDEYEKILKKLKTYLGNYIKSRDEKGSIAKFRFSESDNDLIVGIANIKSIYSVFPNIFRSLEKMSDINFEKFSAYYIRLHLSDFSFVTRRSGDGGIDFMGNGIFKNFVNISGNPIDLKNKSITFKIIGQSKRYKIKNPIGPKDIREFLGSTKIMQDALNPNKENAWLGERNVLEQLKLADPFIYIFLTTSYYSEDAVKLANKLGIYIYDIDDIIFDLINHSIGITNGKFDVVKFEKWFS